MNDKKHLQAVLIHGMGRSPLAMSVLAARLQRAGIRPHLFGYSVTFERLEHCVRRLESFIRRRIKTEEYIMVGHSLGGVLTRATLPRLVHKPAACFLLTSPTRRIPPAAGPAIQTPSSTTRTPPRGPMCLLRRRL